MKWYNTKHELPRVYKMKDGDWMQSKPVLVWHRDGGHPKGKPEIGIAIYQVDSDGEPWWIVNKYIPNDKTVTHWMNTPKPPEEERMAHWITASKQTPRTRSMEKGENGYSMSKRLSVIYLDPHTDRPAYAYAQYRKDHATGRGMWIKDGGEIINTVTHWQKSPLPTNLDEEIAKVRE